MQTTTKDVRTLMIERHVDIPYYEEAEGWLGPFWSEGSPFLAAFATLNLSATAEIACGHGRHAAQAIDRIGSLVLVDVNKSNMDACRRRFSGRPNTRYLVNDGSSLKGIRDESMTAVFCYDAMVHFEAADVISYIAEISRVLAPNGRALLHYSNNDAPGVDPFKDPAWRNYFSRSMMQHFASRNGLTPIMDVLIPWAGRQNIDGLVLLEKSGRDGKKSAGRIEALASRLLSRLMR